MNLGNLIDNTVAKYGQRTALVSGDTRRTYADLDDRAGRLAGALLGRGLKPGDRVALLSHNTDYFVESYLALTRVGLVAVPVNFRLVGPEIVYILQNSQAKAIIHGPEFSEVMAGIKARLPEVRLFLCPGSSDQNLALDYEAFLQSGVYTPSSSQIGEADPCQIIYTSGTTGKPKGAVLTHRNIIWNAFNIIHGRDDDAGQVAIIVGPLHHSAPLNHHLTVQLALGGTCILAVKFEPRMVLECIEREKVTTISGSPAMYNLLLRHPGADKYDTSSVTKCTVGADRLSVATKKEIMKFFPNIDGLYDIYGCTEVSPVATILKGRDCLRKDGSVGRAVAFSDVRVFDENDREAPVGEVGEIVCRGPNVMPRYHDDPPATAKALRNGWLHTGDLAYMDEDGFFFFVDRKKDMIVSGGENIYPREVEEVLATHPDILEAAMVAMPDPTWGESARVFVVTQPGKKLSSQEVIEFCKQNLASYKKPKRVDFVEELPRNASGKVLKRQLRDIPLQGGDGD
ncbi:MAG: long-chain fatty acid--CoA ligase [Proteobacteria bacterium]|nr:long-chain fatty acid--CoA ligase [Pseudomonadota bacterium]MBU4382912.1 long-chain fatty acid--CoA ligase [Pseudomonadota bacterium]